VNPVRLVALDLDGTLISERLEVSKVVVDAISRVRKLGVPFTMVTGRMFAAALPFARKIGIEGPIVCYQGAATYVVESGERLSHVPVPADVAARVFSCAKEDGVRVLGYFEDKLYTEANDEYTKAYTDLARVEPHVVDSLVDFFSQRPSTKINCVTGREAAAAYIERLRLFLGGTAYITRSQPQFVEILNPDVDKGRALAGVARYYGTDLHDVMAIGDSWNDVPLLSAAGTAVAMGTSPPELIARADAVVAGVEDDGVAEALERFILSPASSGKALH
jgi:Cof subfamily protein (haloacid dehalogenase superfamily)